MDVSTDIGSGLEPYACGLVGFTSGAAGDNTAVTGATIDRQAVKNAFSAQVCLDWLATVSATFALQAEVEIQDSADGSSWNTAVVLQAAGTQVQGPGSAQVGQKYFNVNLIPYNRYVRFNFTPKLTKGSIDTAVVALQATLGGIKVKPAP